MSSTLFWLMLAACCSIAASYKILIVDPLPAPSHYNLGKGVADILHSRGHEVTFMNCFPSKKVPYRVIGVPELLLKLDTKMFTFENSKDSAFFAITKMKNLTPMFVETALNNTEIQKMLKDKTEKFDLVIIDYFMNEAFIGFGVKYDCPVVMLSTISMIHWLARDSGNPVSPAIIPNAFLSFAGAMTFQQRMVNTLMTVVQEFMGWAFLKPDLDTLYKTYFPEEAAKVGFYELKKKIALVLVNSHPSLGYARPMLPNAVEIGGYHIGDVPPLPEKYQNLLDSAKNGVVFFSMGSNLKSASMPVTVRKDILKSLGKLKQLVLWKFEEDLPEKPDNVIISSWMPQTSILAHPNVKLFISHGGLLSTIEAASAGVPLLAIPIFGDQFHNARSTEQRGNGLSLEFTNITEESLTWALNEMLSNSKYEQTAKKIHSLFHDRPMHPRDLVGFYCEHVIRTGGAPHLSAPDLSLSSSMLLDVTAVLLLPPILLLWGICCFCRKICKKNKCATKQVTKDKQKKN